MEQTAVYTTQAPLKRDDRRRIWWCPKCHHAMGMVITIGDYEYLVRPDHVSRGDSWEQCEWVNERGKKCGEVRHWVELRTQVPGFIRGERHIDVRTAIEQALLVEAALFAEAEAEIKNIA